MALVLALDTNRRYLENSIINCLNAYDIEARFQTNDASLQIFINEKHPKLEEFLASLEATLPASLFLKEMTHQFDEQLVDETPVVDVALPHSVGLCPSCQTELFDPNSRRYYYPFIHCNSCGNAHALLSSYPFTRENSVLKYTAPCDACVTQTQIKGRFYQHESIGCHECGIAVRLSDFKSERYANDAPSYKKLFEVAAAALNDGKTVRVKSMMGYRLLSKVPSKVGMNLLVTDSSAITAMFSLIKAEYHALLSIERPVLHVAIKDVALQEECRAKSINVKCPDDGFMLLLAAQSQALGLTHLFYAPCNAQSDADLVLDFDLPIHSEPDCHLLIHKEYQLLHHGTRGLLPLSISRHSNIASVANALVGVPFEGQLLIDSMEHITHTDATGVNVLESETQRYHSNQKIFSLTHAMSLSAIHEHGVNEAITLCFEARIHFFYYRRGELIEIIPAQSFQGANLLENIASLRSGSDRLLHQIRTAHSTVFKRLQALEALESATIFEVVHALLDVDSKNAQALLQLALSFGGKGGVKIDMHIRDNRFDYTAMIASFLSYFAAGVAPNILAFSFFESLADYMNEVLQELMQKSSCKQVVLCGDDLAYQPLFSRLISHLRVTPPLLSQQFTIGKESAVVGGLYC